jgi:hypothetical protein
MIDDPSKDDALQTLQSLVRGAAPQSFDAGFAERVQSRLGAQREQAFSNALQRQFRLIVPIAAAAALTFAAFNWWSAHETAVSPFDAALNLPQVALSSAYSVPSLYGDYGVYGVIIPTETP